MNSTFKKLALCTLLGASISAHAAQVFFPNGEFTVPAGADWGTAKDGLHTFNFPASGGFPDGYAEIVSSTSAPGSYAVLISNTDAPYPLASLGLVAGNTYTFTYDMKASVAGANKGGIKVESWSATTIISNSGNQRVTAASTGWATYTYNYTIAPTATHIKLVPLWTPNETVGFDNMRVNNTPVVAPPVVPDQIPNGDFSIANGSNWNEETAGPVITYPSTGGNLNDGGCAIIDASVTDGFAAIEAFDGAEKTFASLGLAPGDTFFIQMDMKILAGSNIGGVRLVGGEGFEAPAVSLQRPAIIGGGSTWQTYSIPITVPVSPAQARFTFLSGSNSKVAYDNIKIVLPGPAQPLQATITPGAILSWTAASAVNGYQPQTSSNGTAWTDLGPVIVGNTTTSIFDAPKAKFYQVLESTVIAEDAVYNGGFEEDDGFTEGAEGWDELGFTGPDQDTAQAPVRILTGAHTGTACMQVKAQSVVEIANEVEVIKSGKSLIQQNTLGASVVIGEIIPGNTYKFSFWAKQINSGVSYVQQYKVAFLNVNSGIVGTTNDVNFSAGANWTEIIRDGLVAPPNAKSALIEIVGLTGAVLNVSGEVHIDDVSLVSATFNSPTVIPSTSIASVEISWPSKTGKSYQVQSSDNLGSWSNFSGVIPGNGFLKAVYDGMAIPKNFYRVGVLP